MPRSRSAVGLPRDRRTIALALVDRSFRTRELALEVDSRLASRFLPLLVAIALCAACASTGAVPRPFPRPESASASTAGRRHVEPDAIVATALSLRGVPYRNGGSDPLSGFDCSGFVAYVFGEYSSVIPRTVAEQYALGRSVAPRALEAGDLVFFSTSPQGASHVGIVISREEFIHAPSSSGVVRVERIRSPYWSSRFVGARRLH
jgi:cell wall-associated NlpC family hydrolase